MDGNNCLSLGTIVGLIKSMILKYGGTGIASVEAVPPNGIKFTFSDGSSTIINLDITAQSVSYDDKTTELGASDVQSAIELLKNAIPNYKLYSEIGQNTDGAMTQKAVTDIIGDINTALDEINGEVI